MVATATRTILENLDRLPDEDQRTKIAIICYDSSLYFFSIPVSHSRYLTVKLTVLTHFYAISLAQNPLCLLSQILMISFCPNLPICL